LALESSLLIGTSAAGCLIARDPLLAEDRKEGCEERSEEADVKETLSANDNGLGIRCELRLYLNNEGRANGREETRLNENQNET
jgi:hypothetical protein